MTTDAGRLVPATVGPAVGTPRRPPDDEMRPGRRVARRRRELLDAADVIVQRDGPAASMASIAAEAGITKPILYRHFGDKTGLYQALAERHTEDLLERVRAGLRTPGDLRDRTRATIDAYLAAIDERPQVYRFLMHRAAAEDAATHGQMTHFVRRLGEELAAGIARETGVEPHRAAAWAHGIVGMVQGAGDWWLETQAVSRAALVADLAGLLLGDFTPRP